jgi:uncharacterized membrane protein (UPF0127 family)
MKIFLKIFLVIIAVVILGFLFFYSSETLFAPDSSRVCFDKNCFTVELAKTDAEREQGLMYRTQLAKNTGMLFLFDTEGIYPFWMKNTLIPLDIIWLNRDKKVVFIGKNNQPCKVVNCPVVNPQIGAKYVLEVNGGISQEMGIKVDDVADFYGIIY